ncbi:hypothetical protein D3C72_2075050 [compost metagenome]
MSHLRRNRLYALIQHFHVAAERDQRDDKLSTMAISATPKRFTEANRKTLDPHTATPRNPEMAKFVHSDEYTKCNNERRQIP